MNILIEQIQKQSEVIQDGLLAYFKATPESFFFTNEIKVERVGADNKIAEETTYHGGEFTYISPAEIEDYDVKCPKIAQAIPFNFDGGNNNRLVLAGSETVNSENYKTAQMALKLESRTLVLINRTKRAMQRQAAEGLQYGKVFLSKRNAALKDVDYGFSDSMFADITTAWVNADGTVNQSADPIGDLNARMKAIFSASGVSQFDIIMTDTALNGFLQNKKVADFADKNKINFANINPQDVRDDGLALYGSYFIGNRRVNIYAFDGSYKDKEESTLDYLEDGRVLVMPRVGGVYRVFFGGIEEAGELDERLKKISPTENITIFGDRKAIDVRIFTSKEKTGVYLNLVSCPLLLAVSKNTHGSFNVLAAA